jgi:hypothetical protein
MHVDLQGLDIWNSFIGLEQYSRHLFNPWTSILKLCPMHWTSAILFNTLHFKIKLSRNIVTYMSNNTFNMNDHLIKRTKDAVDKSPFFKCNTICCVTI